MVHEVLRKLGLTHTEVNIYLELIKKGPLSAGKIATGVEISRTYVYDAIQQLLEKNFVSYTNKNNHREYKAVDLKRILECIDDKMSELQELKKQAHTAMKDLKRISRPKTQPVVEVFEGVQGFKTVLNDIVKEGKDVVGWGGKDVVKQYLPAWFIKKYVNEKAKKGMKTRQIHLKNEGVLKGKGYENKTFPRITSSPVTFATYGHSLVIFFYAQSPFFIRILNKEIAHSFKEHFEFLWENIGSKKISAD